MKPRRPMTLRGRVALAAVLVLAGGVLTVTVNVLLSDRLAAQADDVLRARAEAAAATVEIAPDGQLTIQTRRSGSVACQSV